MLDVLACMAFWQRTCRVPLLHFLRAVHQERDAIVLAVLGHAMTAAEEERWEYEVVVNHDLCRVEM